uniref:Uncharacterized protein n=1 Tax=Anguilla anguilla TaxID=7936 RepID=A0A0E9PL29_ANGAN
MLDLGRGGKSRGQKAKCVSSTHELSQLIPLISSTSRMQNCAN